MDNDDKSVVLLINALHLIQMDFQGVLIAFHITIIWQENVLCHHFLIVHFHEHFAAIASATMMSTTEQCNYT